MNFSEVLELLKQGKKVKLPHWKGYWVKEDNSVKMYCKNGEVLDIRETDDVFYTLSNIASDEWEVVDDDYEVNEIVTTMRFGEAIRNLKNGKKVARKGWNGKGMYLYLVQERGVDKENLVNEASFHLPNDEIAMHGTDVAVFLSHIDMRTVNGDICVGWLASQTDMLAEDWVIVE